MQIVCLYSYSTGGGCVVYPHLTYSYKASNRTSTINMMKSIIVDYYKIAKLTTQYNYPQFIMEIVVVFQLLINKTY